MVLAVAHDAVLITTHAWTADPIADVTVPHAVGTLGVTGIGSVARACLLTHGALVLHSGLMVRAGVISDELWALLEG